MDIMQRTACMVFKPIMFDNFASLVNYGGESIHRLNDDSLQNPFQKVGY